VEQVCQLLEIFLSGFYGWLNHKPSLRQQRNLELRQAIIALHKKYPALGLNSIHHMLNPNFIVPEKEFTDKCKLLTFALSDTRLIKPLLIQSTIIKALQIFCKEILL